MQNLLLISRFPTAESLLKNRTKLDDFWDFCKKLHKAQKPIVNGIAFEWVQHKLEIKTQKFEASIQQHKEFLRHVPLIIPLRSWLEKQLLHGPYNDELVDCFRELIENQVIPSHDSTGRLWDLELQRQAGHEKIIDGIQTSSEWSFSEKERMVSFYMMFAEHLSIATFGFVPYV